MGKPPGDGQFEWFWAAVRQLNTSPTTAHKILMKGLEFKNYMHQILRQKQSNLLPYLFWLSFKSSRQRTSYRQTSFLWWQLQFTCQVKLIDITNYLWQQKFPWNHSKYHRQLKSKSMSDSDQTKESVRAVFLHRTDRRSVAKRAREMSHFYFQKWESPRHTVPTTLSDSILPQGSYRLLKSPTIWPPRSPDIALVEEWRLLGCYAVWL
jgi:hypothetical protein